MIGVVEPYGSGLGGEGTIVLYKADTKTVVAIDYRSTAPAMTNYPKMIPKTGYAAAAVPGTIAGLSTALEKYGTMKLHRMMAPAILRAEQGFTVNPALARIIMEHVADIMQNDALAKILCPDGLPLEAGDILKNPDLALTLRLIAAYGPDLFYRGELADAIAKEMADNGGFITKEDLSSYQAIVREPVRGMYRGHELGSAPPPSGGSTVIQILQILEHFDVAKNPPISSSNIHLMTEAMKRGFADFTAFIGDPDFEGIPLDNLLSAAYAKKRAAEIRVDILSPAAVEGEPITRESGSTTALCVVDRKGNIVTLTQTLSDFFGAKAAIDGTGIILNNEMRNFSYGGVNALKPGKRMRTTISPMIVLRNGKPFAALGTAGAARIISTTAILVSNLLDHKMGIQEAIESPRYFARDAHSELQVEKRIPQDTLDALDRLGYSLKQGENNDPFFGSVQGIVIDPNNRKRIGGADPRRGGAVAGY